MWTKHNFNGGMAEAIPPELLADNMAVSIENMVVGDAGELKAIAGLDLLHAIPQDVDQAWLWEPYNMPADCVGDYILVLRSGTSISVFYERESSMANTSVASVAGECRAALTPHYFLFVDGMGNSKARRLSIDDAGEINVGYIGARQPIKAPDVKRITADTNRDEEYTGMPVGSILLYSFVVMNRWGEKSNPSPITVMDGAQWQIKGNNDSGEYEYDDHNRGSIKSVEVECRIPDPSEARTVFLYRSHAEYTEGQTPVTTPMLVAIKQMGETDGEVVTITDSSFPASETLDYENDTAPSADLVAISGDTIFLANTGNENSFAFPVSSAIRITLDNKNPAEYVNQWISFCLYDSTAPEDLRMMNIPLVVGANTRLIDGDRITPLEAVYSAENEAFVEHSTGDTCTTLNHFWVRIPVIPMNTSKTIYLVTFAEDVSDYGKPIANGDFKTLMNSQMLTLSPVRNERALRVFGADPKISTTGSSAGKHVNRSNTARSWGIPTAQVIKLLTPQGAETSANVPTVAVGYHQFGGEHVLVSDSFLQEQQSVDLLRTVAYISLYFESCKSISEDWVLIMHTPLYRLYARRTNETGNIGFRITGPTWGPPTGSISPSFSIDMSGGWHLHVTIYLTTSLNPVTKVAEVSWAMLYSAGAAHGIHYKASRSYDTVILTNVSIGLSNQLYVTSPITNDHNIWAGLFHFYCGVEPKNRLNIMQHFAHLPTFEVEGIGVCNTTTIGESTYGVNLNISIEDISLAAENRPGKVRWSAGGTMPELREILVHEGIAEIFPIRSFAPTDEHNSLLVWTNKGDLKRIAFIGERAELVPEIVGIGKPTQGTVTGAGTGVAWCNPKHGVIYFDQRGISYLTRIKIEVTPSMIYFIPGDNLLMAVTSTGWYYCNMQHQAWTKVEPLAGKVFAAGDYGVILESGVYGKDGTLAEGEIFTRAYFEPKMNRIILSGEGDDISVGARLMGSKYSGGFADIPAVEVEMGKPFSIPGTKGARGVQLLISGNIDKLNYIEIEGASPEE